MLLQCRTDALRLESKVPEQNPFAGFIAATGDTADREEKNAGKGNLSWSLVGILSSVKMKIKGKNLTEGPIAPRRVPLPLPVIPLVNWLHSGNDRATLPWLFNIK